MPVYNLSASFDLKNSLVRGKALIELKDAAERSIQTGKNLRISKITLNGSPFEPRMVEGGFKVTGPGTLEIDYEGVFKGGGVQSLENVGVVSTGLISEKAISLTGNWYPMLRGLAYYRLSATVPENFTAISEADTISVKTTPSGREFSFSFPHPMGSVDLVAGDYAVSTENVDGIEVSTYFFREDQPLSARYIEYTKKYLRMYSALLVPYPFKRFSVVENVLETGYSMPTFTLLGEEVLRLPFIVKTSLGHEIAHQWFGNYVYADFSKGNWLEAVTVFVADYRYKELEGKGMEYRKNVLVNYQSYVHPANEFPLREFRERTDFASAAVGYGKGMMLFEMLRGLVGEEVFYKSLRSLIEANQFRRATWQDIETAFERESGRKLGWFFSQWLDRKGLPMIDVLHPRSLVLKGAPVTTFELTQDSDVYRFRLPVSIKTAEGGAAKTVLNVDKERHTFELPSESVPTALVFDPDYELMRGLSEDEFPPVISRLLGDEKKIVTYQKKDGETYSGLIGIFKSEGFEAREPEDLKDKDVRTSSLLVLGYDNPVLKRLFANVRKPGAGFSITVLKNPLDRTHVVACAAGDSKEEVDAAASKIFRYGKYSTLRFEMGRNVEKETAKSSDGMTVNMYEPVMGVRPKRSLALGAITDDVSGKPIIFIGERHTNYEDHKVELDVIMKLHKMGKKFAIGMEMFQKPYQQPINDYISGKIGEREFLKKTDYFNKWGFDYNYYREILEFARAKGIPVIALNIDSRIVNKVAKGGLDSLTPEEMKEIPPDMNMAGEAYRKRLKEIFESHPAGVSFANFYQSQILWDETMAHSVASYLKEHPDTQMVVLAGAEHIMYDSGIPSRTYRLTGKQYATLINGVYDADIGSYVLFPQPAEPPFSAKLGVVLKDAKEGAVIENFAPESVAFKAGLEKGDIIKSVGGWKVDSVADVKIAMFDKVPGQSVKVRVARKRFIFGYKEMEFEVNL
ncbi:MAG: ChaN family lipoprotein [Nitrospiraceae bacterium]|nr:ChaN family lipoprotein [Nitrospiraceae bacterium]